MRADVDAENEKGRSVNREQSLKSIIAALIMFPWIIIVMLLVNLPTLMRLWRLSHWGQNVDSLLVILELL